MSEFVAMDGDSLANSATLDFPREPRGVLLVRLFISGLLLATAALKIFSPAEMASMAVTFRIPPLLTGAVVQMELALAACLLSGCWTKRTLIASATLFGIFGAFSIYRAWAGEESCGCFGSLKVDPWATAMLDGTTLLLAGWAACKAPSSSRRAVPRRLLVLSTYPLAGLLAAIGMITNAPRSSVDTVFLEESELVILEPNKWIGKPFPLVPHVTPRVQFDEGRWTILIYHHDCHRCQEAVPLYERLAANHAAVENGHRVVLIETPPFGLDRFPVGRAIRARLADVSEWFIQTPVEIQVNEGVVVSASLDLPAVSTESAVFSEATSDLSSSALLTD